MDGYKDLGLCPNPLAFWKKQDQKLLLKPHEYAVLDGSRGNGKEVPSVRRTALLSKVMTIPLCVFEGKTLKVLTFSTR